MSVFVDTSAWFAAINRKDRDHHRAAEILRQGHDLVTSDFVLVETWLLVKNRIDFATARAFWDALRAGLAMVERVSEVDLEQAWTLGRSFPDQTFSLVDLASFALCERKQISKVFSLDNDFVIYRCGRDRNQAFEVLR